jgi:hypothetical protein
MMNARIIIAKARGLVADAAKEDKPALEKAEKIVTKQKKKFPGSIKNQWGLIKHIYDNIEKSKTSK